MSSCSSDIPIFFQVNGVCTGHGVCVNSTVTPNLLLCKCNPYYNGGSDYFDSRVELLPSGEYLSYACNNSMLSIYIVWSFWLLVGVVRSVITLPIWVDFCKKHFRDPMLRSKGIFDTPFRIITMDLFAINSLLFIAGIAKIYGGTIGTDFLPTFCYNTAVLLYQISSFDLSKMEFDIFVQCSSNPIEARKAKNMRMTLKILGLFISICLVYIPGMCSLLLDKSQGLLFYGGNGEEIVIYLRNIDVIIYIPLEVFATWIILRRIKMVFVFNGMGDESAVKHIIKKMEDAMKFYMRSIGLLMLVYASFSIPYLLPYQTYCLSLVLGLGIANPNSKAFATEKEKEQVRALSSKSTTSHSSKEIKPDSGSGLDDKTMEILVKDNQHEIERTHSERILQVMEYPTDDCTNTNTEEHVAKTTDSNVSEHVLEHFVEEPLTLK
jgi:hypothetical protein